MDRIVYDEWLRIKQRDIGGHKYDILFDYNAVACIIENEFGEILLVRQFRPALMEYTLEIPSGVRDDQAEDAFECILREIYEETNICLTRESINLILSYKPNVGFSNSYLQLYHAKVSKACTEIGEIADDEVKETLWMNINELEDRIKTQNIMDIKTIVSYLWLKSRVAL
jgi:ADP-ribose pyrophosphatase